jgi:hypothetical protein
MNEHEAVSSEAAVVGRRGRSKGAVKLLLEKGAEPES